MLDEPSSELNVEETDDMSFWIRDMRSELGITVLMVEHDMTLVNRSVRPIDRAELRPRAGDGLAGRGCSAIPTSSPPISAHEDDAMSASDII